MTNDGTQDPAKATPLNELNNKIAELTRSKGQTIDNDTRILVPIAISELLPIITEQVRLGRIDELDKVLKMVENYEVGAAGFGSARFNVPGIPPNKIEDRLAQLKDTTLLEGVDNE